MLFISYLLVSQGAHGRLKREIGNSSRKRVSPLRQKLAPSLCMHNHKTQVLFLYFRQVWATLFGRPIVAASIILCVPTSCSVVKCVHQQEVEQSNFLLGDALLCGAARESYTYIPTWNY